MVPEVDYNFLIVPDYFPIVSRNGDVITFGPGFTKLSEANSPCGADAPTRNLTLGKLASGRLLADVTTGQTACANMPQGYVLKTAAPDGYALASFYASADDQTVLKPTKIGRMDSDVWVDLPAGTEPHFGTEFTRFLTPAEPGGMGSAVLTTYETAEFTPPAA